MDVGEVADWWGEKPRGPTCRSGSKARPTRIDGILANPLALISIHDFEVERHEMITTHSFLRIEVSKKELKEERQCVRKVGSLKQLFENKMQEAKKDLERREALEKRKEEVARLQEYMDENFRKTKERFEKASKEHDTDKFWKEWGKAVEDAYLKAIALDNKEAEKRLKGRGEVIIASRTNKGRKAGKHKG